MLFPDAKEMFCFQCEQTEHGTGCTTIGVCGKTPQVAAMQDCLVETLKGLSYWAEKARELNQPTTDADNFVSGRCPAVPTTILESYCIFNVFVAVLFPGYRSFLPCSPP